MKFTTLIPIRFNDGTEIPGHQLQRIINDLAFEFGGCSEEGTTKGQWIDRSDSTHYRDECMRVSVICDRSMLEEARAAVIRIGKELHQRAMYFEVRDYDGVQFIENPGDGQ
jgi:hypothetical protein